MRNDFSRIFEKKEALDVRRMSLRELAVMLQDTANGHLQDKNLGEQGMWNRGLAWVIVRRQLKIERMPKRNEDVKVTTYAGRGRHGIYPRWYDVSVNDEKIVDVSCQWTIIDMNERELMMEDVLPEDVPYCERKDYGTKLSPPPKFLELDRIKKVTVTEKKIDHNGHVNNSWYLEWAEEIVHEQYRKAGKRYFEPYYLWVEYIHEIYPNETVELKWTVSKDGDADREMYDIKGFVRRDGQELCAFSLVVGVRDDSASHKRLTDEMIQKLYDEFGTPEHVKGHCRGVTDCAMGIAKALNKQGYDLDLDLIYGAGMIHDTARTLDEHWNVIADRLLELGYIDESKIVREHMKPTSYSDIEDMNEADMIFLGDRLVKEDKYVGIDERFNYIMEKARQHGVLDYDMLMYNKAKMRRCMDEIEQKIGCTIDSLFDR